MAEGWSGRNRMGMGRHTADIDGKRLNWVERRGNGWDEEELINRGRK